MALAPLSGTWSSNAGTSGSFFDAISLSTSSSGVMAPSMGTLPAPLIFPLGWTRPLQWDSTWVLMMRRL